MLQTPIALIIFNRPETTARVFASIRAAQPEQFFVIADGPRSNRPDDVPACAAARAVVAQVDWPCDVRQNFATENLGCRRRVASGLDWVFDEAERAIILEDDCLPDPSFYRYCEELLARWELDDRIWSISGDNFQRGRRRTPYSYYFSRYGHIWGWATWRRAWRANDDAMSLWPTVRDEGWLADLFDTPAMVDFWTTCFQAAYEGKVDTWDYQWQLTCWLQNGLAILPNVNLVTNIGHGPQATHTTGPVTDGSLPVTAMSFPIQHPPFVIRDARADAFTDETAYLPMAGNSGWRSWSRALKSRLRLGRG